MRVLPRQATARAGALTALMVVLLAPPILAAEGDGHAAATVTVRVINETPGGSAVADDPVTLKVFRGQDLLDVRQGAVDETGTAVFAEVPAGPDCGVVAVGAHAGVSFESRMAAVTGDPRPVTLEIHVYDTTADRSFLSVGMHHIIVKRLPEALLVTEYFQLRNVADRVVNPPAPEPGQPARVFSVSLPQGYRDFESIDHFVPAALVFTKDGFYDTMAIAPGVYDVTFSYVLDIKRSMLTFAKRFTTPTEDVILFLALRQARPEGLGAADGEMTLSDGVPAAYFQLGPQAAGAELRFVLTGFEVSGPDSTSWIALAVFFVVLMVFVTRRVVLGRRAQAAPREDAPEDKQ